MLAMSSFIDLTVSIEVIQLKQTERIDAKLLSYSNTIIVDMPKFVLVNFYCWEMSLCASDAVWWNINMF